MHAEFVNSQSVADQVENTGIRRFTHWPPKRITLALKNFDRMKQAFERCGLEDDSYSQISELSDDVCIASTEILSAFSQWAEAHLSSCRNINVHIHRMETKWSDIYKSALGCGEDQSVGGTNPNTHRFCEIIDGWTAECSPEQCYPYVHEDDYFYNYDTYDYYYEDFSCEYTVSTVCDPNFVDTYGDDCDWYERNLGYLCEDYTNENFLHYGFLTTEGYKTGLNCPACGCGENGPINMHDREGSRSLTGDDKKTKKNHKN